MNSCSTKYVVLSVISTDDYFVTLPIHSQVEVTIVIRYLRQSVRCDVLGQRSPNYGPLAKSGLQRLFVNNE